MEFKGTKGEWVIDKYNSISCNGKTVLVGSGLGFTMHEDEEPKANAKLISSAPDLLELCLLVYNSFGGGNVITFSEKDIENFKQAIEKALK